MLRNKYAVAIIASMAVLMAVLDNTIVNVALTPMSAAFGASLNSIQWVITSFFLAQAIIIPIAGYLGSRFGIKRFFLIFLCLFTAGSFLCGLAKTEGQLIIYRVIQGIGGGALFPLGQAIAMEAFPIRERAKASIIIGMSVLLGPIFGPTLGGYLTDTFSWAAIFNINIPLGIITFALAYISFPSDKKTEKGYAPRFDYAGLVLSMLASLLIVYAFAMVTDIKPGSVSAEHPAGEVYGWHNSWIWFLLGSGIITAIVFCFYELRQKDPVLDLRIFKNSFFTTPAIVLWMVAMIVFGSIFLIPVFFEQLRDPHLTAMQTGLALMPQGIAAAVATIIGGRLYYKAGVRAIAIAGCILLAISGFMLTDFSPHYGGREVLPALIIRGLGFGLTFVPAQTLALQSFRGASLAKASSLLNVTRQIFGSIGVSVIATLFTGRMAYYVTQSMAGIPPEAGKHFDAMSQTALVAQNGSYAMNDVFKWLFYATCVLIPVALILPGRQKTQEFLKDGMQGSAISE